MARTATSSYSWQRRLRRVVTVVDLLDDPPHAGALPLQVLHPAPHPVHVHLHHLSLMNRGPPRLAGSKPRASSLPPAATAPDALAERPWTPAACLRWRAGGAAARRRAPAAPRVAGAVRQLPAVHHATYHVPFLRCVPPRMRLPIRATLTSE